MPQVKSEAGAPVTRRRFVSLAAPGAAAGGGVLTACALGGTQPGPAGQPATSGPPVTIEYYTSLNARQNDNHKAMLLDAFTKVNPRITVSIVPAEGDFFTKLRTLAAGGTPPDVTWEAYPEAFLSGTIQGIAQYVKRDKVNLGVWSKPLFDPICTWRGGKILGLPNQSGGNWPVMPYNREVFKQAGVPEPPATWGDAKWNAQAFLEALQKTTKVGPDGKVATYGINMIGAGIYTVSWSGMWKAAWCSDDFKTIICDSGEMVEAIEYLVNLTARHKAMTTGQMMTDAFGDANATNAFLNGRLAMFVTAGGGLFAMAQATADRNLPLAYAPTPFFKATNAGQNLDDNGIVTGAKHPEEAWAYIKWQAETPNWAISRGNFPARADHVDAWAKELYPGDLASRMRLDVYRDSLKSVAKLDPLFLLPSYRQMSSDVIQPAVNKMLAGQSGVAAALKEIKTPLQALVPQNLP